MRTDLSTLLSQLADIASQMTYSALTTTKQHRKGQNIDIQKKEKD